VFTGICGIVACLRVQKGESVSGREAMLRRARMHVVCSAVQSMQDAFAYGSVVGMYAKKGGVGV